MILKITKYGDMRIQKDNSKIIDSFIWPLFTCTLSCIKQWINSFDFCFFVVSPLMLQLIHS